MTRSAPASNWFDRLWTLMIQASAAAVSVHYDAPWQRRPAI